MFADLLNLSNDVCIVKYLRLKLSYIHLQVYGDKLTANI